MKRLAVTQHKCELFNECIKSLVIEAPSLFDWIGITLPSS